MGEIIEFKSRQKSGSEGVFLSEEYLQQICDIINNAHQMIYDTREEIDRVRQLSEESTSLAKEAINALQEVVQKTDRIMKMSLWERIFKWPY